MTIPSPLHHAPARLLRKAARLACGRSLVFFAWIVLLNAGSPRAEAASVPTAPAVAPAESSSAPAGAEDDYLTLGLEDLMDMTVTSVSRKAQRLSDAAAAVFVITQEDLRRSGASSIPEALRMVPGLEVARIDANKWAISSRGFNGRFISKMLVLFDGRTVYTPLFSGVFWDRQDTVLEDIERIEVIRGPGAALWGANAVNGVINIITRSAADTTGALLSAGGGTGERAFGTARYGTALGLDSFLRLYGKYTDRAASEDPTGKDAHDDWHALRGGFRLDTDISPRNTLTLQGDVFQERVHERYLDIVGQPPVLDHTTPVFGANLLSRWKRTFSDTSDLELQLYYDRTDTKMGVIEEQRDSADLDFQHRFALTPSHEVVWGLAYRFSHDRLSHPNAALTLSPQSQDTHLFSSFLQDTVTLAPERLRLILGSKFEVNSYTGFEVQPNARLIWTPSRQHTVWGAVSRAVRTPSRGEESLSLYQPGPQPGVLFHLIGNDRLQAEELIAYEAGYRVEPSGVLSADLALFYNRYRKLSIFSSGEPLEVVTPFPPQVAVPLVLGNPGRAETIGFELASDFRARAWWRLRGSYSFLRIMKTEAPAGADFSYVKSESPRHQVSLRSSFDLPRSVELDLWLRYVSGLDFHESPAVPPVAIGSYLTLDCRLAWRPWRRLELALVGQNLLQDQHREFLPQQIFTEPTQVGRSVYGKVTWQY